MYKFLKRNFVKYFSLQAEKSELIYQQFIHSALHFYSFSLPVAKISMLFAV